MKLPKIFKKRVSPEDEELRALEALELVAQAHEKPMHPKFQTLLDYINKTPAAKFMSAGDGANNTGWWVKLDIDIHHPLAWNIVQEYGYVLNYLSLTEPLPTVFKPVSPPPYMNGGPSDFLSWVIECPINDMAPGTVKKWLEERLPNPVDDPESWKDIES